MSDVRPLKKSQRQIQRTDQAKVRAKGDDTHLQVASWELQQRLRVLTVGAVDSGSCRVGVRFLGAGDVQIARGIQRLARDTRQFVWNMQPSLPFANTLLYRSLNRDSRRQGLASRVITSPASLAANPLVASEFPHLRIAPVFLPLSIVDLHHAILPGALTASGASTAWFVTEPALVQQARSLWEETWAVSVPVAEAFPSPLLTERQVDIVHALVRGIPDRTIARGMGVSQRTLERDIGCVLSHMGADSRADLISRVLRPF